MKGPDYISKYKLDYLVIILLSFPILFLKLGSFSLRLWDESIYATNSIEMMERGEWIVPYFDGKMDYWNSKPPMINWLQIISMKSFGISEMAIRLPSAIAALLTVLLVYWFLKKHFNVLTGFVAAMVLLTSVGFVTFHGARTGDTDALITFFLTGLSLLTLDSLLTGTVSNKKIIGFFIFLFCGFMTKSVAIFLFLPPIIIYILYFQKSFWLQLARNRVFWISGTSAALLIAGFVILRNSLQPGYIDLILYNEMGRIGSSIENHHEPFAFYIDNFVNHRYSYWILFVMTSFILLFVKEENKKRKKVIQFVSCISIFYFAFISISVTKLAWYDLPLFPILAMNIALLFLFVFERIRLTNLKTSFILLILFILPYKNVFGLSQTNHYNIFEMQNEVKERYLKQKLSHPAGLPSNSITVYHADYKRSLIFYKYIYAELNINIKITDVPKFRPGEIVMISSDNLRHEFIMNHDYLVIETFENLNIYQVK